MRCHRKCLDAAGDVREVEPDFDAAEARLEPHPSGSMLYRAGIRRPLGNGRAD